jgi:S-DNA-T family DNA segregation ATPase FtsK/SpoIIIE
MTSPTTVDAHGVDAQPTACPTLHRGPAAMKPTDVNLTLGGGLTPDGERADSLTLPLAKAPHILIAGMTGAGKSVVVHSLITQMLEWSPRWVNLVLIDPKRVEFTPYAYLPHVVSAWPRVAYSVQDAEEALGHFALGEMMGRFHDMGKAGVRSWDELPHVYARTVIVIDELANLVLRSKDVERYIVDIASMGRAAGIHLILATQSPRADVITGLIRANVPTRIALATFSATESRIILDRNGAEDLSPPGEMLIRLPGRRDLCRTWGPFLSDEDVDTAIERARR